MADRGFDTGPSGPTQPTDRGLSVAPQPAVGSWQPKVVALDIDGTLFAWVDGLGATYETVSPAVLVAIKAAIAGGALIVLCSGRSPHGIEPVVAKLGLDDPDNPAWVVASNGGVVFRYPPLDLIHEETFDAREAVETILAAHPDVMVAVEERGVGYRLNRHFPDGELAGVMTIAEIDELLAEPVSRVIIRDPEATADDFVALVERLGLSGTNYVVGWTAWLDLSPVGVDKSSGLARVCADLGVGAPDVLAIGDGRNDIEMLQWAGRGVAMGQAWPEVKAIADDVTATVYDDGVAVELRRWFP